MWKEVVEKGCRQERTNITTVIIFKWRFTSHRHVTFIKPVLIFFDWNQTPICKVWRRWIIIFWIFHLWGENINFYFSIFLYFSYFTTFSWFMCKNGTLRHSLATLEGCNLLWHIVAPPPPSTPRSFKMFELSHSSSKKEGLEYYNSLKVH